MKTVVIGPGAMGCLFAGLLVEADHDVWILDKSCERAEIIAKSGIRIEGIGGERKVDVKATNKADEIGITDLVFVWVKAYSTRQAIKSAKAAIGKYTQVISLQNGLGNVEAMLEYVDADNVIAGTTSHGATLLDVGKIKHAGTGATTIGRINGVINQKLKQIANLLSGAKIKTQISDDIESVIWTKLIINAAINPLTAITRLKNGQLLDFRDTRILLDKIADEAKAVAGKAGISLTYPDMKTQIREVCRATAANTASMLQDVLRHRKTEIDAINGAIVKKADELGMSAPVNETLTRIIKTIETNITNGQH